jgi:hypothetical protein
MDYIYYGECLLVDSDLSYSSPGNTPAVDACSLKALFMELDGPLFSYQPLLLDNTLSVVQLLVEKVQEARGMLSSRLNSSENLRLSQQQSSPHSHHSHLPCTPPLQQVVEVSRRTVQ